MPYQLTDLHSCADVGLIATGRDLEELFADTAAGMTAIMVDGEGLDDRRKLSFELEEENLDDLFYKWLSELIYYKDAEEFLLKRCVLQITENHKIRLKAELFGDTIDPERHVLKIDVKAVTYYRFRIEKVRDQWQGEVVFDL
jgi:SHS2 domain-containing protein